jgi:hypothetical protein
MEVRRESNPQLGDQSMTYHLSTYLAEKSADFGGSTNQALGLSPTLPLTGLDVSVFVVRPALTLTDVFLETPPLGSARNLVVVTFATYTDNPFHGGCPLQQRSPMYPTLKYYLRC